MPKAYINFMFFDEQFKYVPNSRGASRVGTSGSVKDHWVTDAQLQNIIAPQNGYIFVYVSNESNFDVFFDNLQVVDKLGTIVEETSYYPFGLTMAGISSKAASSLINRYKYNGKELQNQEFSDGSGLEWYDYKYRFYDDQIGRFFCVDRLATKYPYYSPYQYAGNKVPNAIDRDGLEDEDFRAIATDRESYYESYKTTEGFVPDATYGSSGINVYEPLEGADRVTDPTITRNNPMGEFAVNATKAIDDLKEDIKSVTEETDHNITRSGVDNSGSSITIEWKDPKAEKQFNTLQNTYDNKIKEIDKNNPMPAMPSKNASDEEKFKYNLKAEGVQGTRSIQKSLLGQSPTQIIMKALKDNHGGFTKVSEKTETKATVREIPN